MSRSVAVAKIKSAADIFTTVLVAVAAAALLWTQIENRWAKSRPYQSHNVSGLTIQANKVRHARGGGPTAIVEFTDYECPFCRSHARNTALAIDREFIATGKLRYVIFNFPIEAIHPRARKAGEAAECAARQGLYWEMHERLFNAETDLGAVAQLAGPLGLNRNDFTRCLEGETTDEITADLAEGRRLGVTSTPTFFVGLVLRDGSIRLTKRVNGAVPIEVFREAIGSIGNGPTGWRGLFSVYVFANVFSPRLVL